MPTEALYFRKFGTSQAFSQGPKRGRPIFAQQYIYSKGGGGGGVMLLNLLYLTTTFPFSQVHHQLDQNVKCIIIIMRIEAISFQIY